MSDESSNSSAKWGCIGCLALLGGFILLGVIGLWLEQGNIDEAHKLWAAGDKEAAIKLYTETWEGGSLISEDPKAVANLGEYFAEKGDEAAARKYLRGGAIKDLQLTLTHPKAVEIWKHEQLRRTLYSSTAMAFTRTYRKKDRPADEEGVSGPSLRDPTKRAIYCNGGLKWGTLPAIEAANEWRSGDGSGIHELILWQGDKVLVIQGESLARLVEMINSAERNQSGSQVTLSQSALAKHLVKGKTKADFPPIIKRWLAGEFK